MKKVDWAGVGIAIIVGLAIGVTVPFLLYWMGLPEKLLGPLVGALSAPAITITYQVRQKRRQGGEASK